MILVINVCKERLHYLEFVKPIEDILERGEVSFFTRHYLDLTEGDLRKATGVIICGTSLKDDQFIEDLEKFDWVKNFDRPLLGICAGMQIIGLTHGGKMGKYLEIGFFHEDFKKNFLGIEGLAEVYHLHNNYVEFGDEFEVYAGEKIPQAVKHKDKPIYGTMLHPEVRQKEAIIKFAELSR